MKAGNIKFRLLSINLQKFGFESRAIGGEYRKRRMHGVSSRYQKGPGPGFEPGSWDPQSQRITTTPSGPVVY